MRQEEKQNKQKKKNFFDRYEKGRLATWMTGWLDCLVGWYVVVCIAVLPSKILPIKHNRLLNYISEEKLLRISEFLPAALTSYCLAKF